jgi:hypothetical protein
MQENEDFQILLILKSLSQQFNINVEHEIHLFHVVYQSSNLNEIIPHLFWLINDTNDLALVLLAYKRLLQNTINTLLQHKIDVEPASRQLGCVILFLDTYVNHKYLFWIQHKWLRAKYKCEYAMCWLLSSCCCCIREK